MIGAMPALALDRNRKNKGEGSVGYFRRPQKLSLHFRPPLTHHQVTPTQSPLDSPEGGPSRRGSSVQRIAKMCAKKRLIFQISVIAPLIGSLLLFIGLIQLTPNAEISKYSVPLIIGGAATFLFGMIVIALRIFCKWELGKYYTHRQSIPQITVNEASTNDPEEPEKELFGSNKDTEEDQHTTGSSDSSHGKPTSTSGVTFSNDSKRGSQDIKVSIDLEKPDEIESPGDSSTSKDPGNCDNDDFNLV